MWVVIVVIIVTTGFGAAGLIVPSRGLHAYIRARKREELAKIRHAIADERATLFSESDRSSVLPRMGDMLAYEARIESVREWPFDTSTLSRFALFLLIPLVCDMLAYEARIESVREWPFDTSTLSRFALFLLIPLVSWIGGALVERIVDSALG